MKNRLKVLRAERDWSQAELAERLLAIGRECAALPDHDTRSPDEIIGYDEHGMW